MHKVDDEGLVGIYEAEDPDLLLHFGSRLYRTRVPEGSRILFPRPPVPDVGDLRAAAEHALDHPYGSDPFNSLLRPGMKVTIAMDDRLQLSNFPNLCLSSKIMAVATLIWLPLPTSCHLLWLLLN